MFETATIVESSGKRGHDRAAVIEHPQGLVVALADGAGGTSGAAEAADTVIRWARAFAGGDGDISDPEQWCLLLSRVDYQISCAGGQTTAVVAGVTQDGVFGASVGDSAAWLIGSEDHADLTANQQRKPLLGSDAAKPAAFRAELAGRALLVASDGLVKYAPSGRICRAALRDTPRAAAKRLVDLVRLKSGALPDDLALILCKPRT